MLIEFKQFPDEMQNLISNNQSFQQALQRLAVGTPDTKSSWFYEDVSDKSIVLGWITKKLSAMKDLKAISEYDLSKTEKFSPQGGSAPLKDRLNLFEEYFSNLQSPQITRSPLWQIAKRNCVRNLGFNRTGKPLTLDEVVNRGLINNKYFTNSGYPLFIKRKRPEAIAQALEAARSGEWKEYPFVLGTRAQMGKTHELARSIFMAPMARNIQGQRYVTPLMDYIRSKNIAFFLPWEGYDHVQTEISRNWFGTVKIGADYSKMDQHFNKWHAAEVYDVVKNYFDPSWWEDLRYTIESTFTAKIVTNLGLINQEHAMPSGSEWTNFLETMWNYIFVEYLRLKYHIQFQSSMGIGDDQLWFIPGSWTDSSRDKFAQLISKEFDFAGLPGQPEKQEISNSHCTFLQRFSTDEWSGVDGKTPGAGVYSLVRNLTSQIYPERYHNEKQWDHNMFALRAIMIAENSCQHPLFEWYVKEIVAKANPHILEFAALKDSEIRVTQQNSKTINGLSPTYNQEKENADITTFKTLELLRQILGTRT